MNTPIIFLDIDGVLNDHTKMPNHYSGIMPHCRDSFNLILDEVPEAKVVIHSSWRYPIHQGSMNLDGLQTLFLTHGLKIYNRLHGYTISDEVMADALGTSRADFSTLEKWYEWVHKHGIRIRRHQIQKYIKDHGFTNYAIIDDIDLDIPGQFITEGSIGLTLSMANKIIDKLR